MYIAIADRAGAAVSALSSDTIIFNKNASRHPFYIKTKFSRGVINQVKTGTLSGTQGTQYGKLSWKQRAYQLENIIMFVLHMLLLAWAE